MNPDSFCTEFNDSLTLKQPAGRRLSTSWDNEEKANQLLVPRVEQRRNSNTLAQLLECHRQLSLSQDGSQFFDCDDTIRSRPASRRASVGSRRPSVAEMLIDSGVSKTTDDCVMVQQTLGTSTTLFFQKNPLVDNLDLRPSAIERGLYNFDDSIKETPPLKYFGTPRPSIQMTSSPRLSLVKSEPSIEESESGESTPTLKDIPIRPSIGERGLPAMKFAPVLPNGQLQERGRTLHKLSPTGVPVQNPNRRSITVEGSLPELLDRPYVRASPADQGTPDGKTPTKTVTIRVPDDHPTQPRGHFVHRSATPSPNNTSNGRREKSASP
ncbi:unnamed protein product [Caenorhabditis brenneri]